MTFQDLHEEARLDPLLEAWNGEVVLPAFLPGEDGSPPVNLHSALLHRDYGVALLDLAPDERLDAAERFRRIHRLRFPDQPVPPVVYRSLAPLDLWRLTIVLDSAFALEPPLAEQGTDWMDRARDITARQPEAVPPPLSQAEVPVSRPDESEAAASLPPEAGTPSALPRRTSRLILLPLLAGVAAVVAVLWLHSPEPRMDVGAPGAGAAPPRADSVPILALQAPSSAPDLSRGDELPSADAIPTAAAARWADLPSMSDNGTDPGPAPQASGTDLASLPAPPPPARPSLPPLETVSLQLAGPSADLLDPAFELASAPLPPGIAGPVPPPVPEASSLGPALPDPEAGAPVPAALPTAILPVLAQAPWPEPEPAPPLQNLAPPPVPPQPDRTAPPEDLAVAAPPPSPIAAPSPEETVSAEAPGEEPPRPTGRADPAPGGADPALLDVLLRRGDALLALGDVSAARLFYERAAAAGSGPAAVAMARTYDPAILEVLGVRGLRPERSTAIAWYRRAAALGAAGASGPLRRLEAQEASR